METILYRLLMIVIAFNIFALGLLILFLINARFNLKRDIIKKRFYVKAILLAKKCDSSEDAAQKLHVTPEKFTAFCKEKNIELPEQRNERIQKEKEEKEEKERQIAEEEATWRAEKEKIKEERRRAQEEEAKERKERLKKFGFN